jgi:hypothetical protein
MYIPHPCILTNATKRRDDAAAALMSLYYAWNSKTDKKPANESDGVINETNRMLDARCVCDVLSRPCILMNTANRSTPEAAIDEAIQ